MSRARRFNEWFKDLISLRECAMFGAGVLWAGIVTYGADAPGHGAFLSAFGGILIALCALAWVVETYPIPGTKGAT